MSDTEPHRFLTLADVAEVLNTSPSQVYALVRRADLRAIKIGGRGQWRIEAAEVDRYIAAKYDEAAAFIRDHPFASDAHPSLAGERDDDLVAD
jgi:excisionase family DNA binding protein